MHTLILIIVVLLLWLLIVRVCTYSMCSAELVVIAVLGKLLQETTVKWIGLMPLLSKRSWDVKENVVVKTREDSLPVGADSP